MPLTTHTTIKDETGSVVEETEAKLYTLAELRDRKHIEDESENIITSGVASAYETALDKLRGWVYEDSWWSETVLDNDAVELFKACGITVPQKTETIHVKVNGKFQWDEQHKPITKTITRDDKIWNGWDLDRREFTVNPRARVDERVFLRALQWYLAGKDIRDLPALQWSQPTPSRPLAASRPRTFDLRSKDARIIREQGLTISEAGGPWGATTRTREFDLDDNHYYDGLSEQTKSDCNELLSDLCHEVLSMLQDEMDYRTSEEALLEDASANDLRFTKEGKIA